MPRPRVAIFALAACAFFAIVALAPLASAGRVNPIGALDAAISAVKKEGGDVAASAVEHRISGVSERFSKAVIAGTVDALQNEAVLKVLARYTKGGKTMRAAIEAETAGTAGAAEWKATMETIEKTLAGHSGRQAVATVTALVKGMKPLAATELDDLMYIMLQKAKTRVPLQPEERELITAFTSKFQKYSDAVPQYGDPKAVYTFFEGQYIYAPQIKIIMRARTELAAVKEYGTRYPVGLFRETEAKLSAKVPAMPADKDIYFPQDWSANLLSRLGKIRRATDAEAEKIVAAIKDAEIRAAETSSAWDTTKAGSLLSKISEHRSAASKAGDAIRAEQAKVTSWETDLRNFNEWFKNAPAKYRNGGKVWDVALNKGEPALIRKYDDVITRIGKTNPAKVAELKALLARVKEGYEAMTNAAARPRFWVEVNNPMRQIIVDDMEAAHKALISADPALAEVPIPDVVSHWWGRFITGYEKINA